MEAVIKNVEEELQLQQLFSFSNLSLLPIHTAQHTTPHHTQEAGICRCETNSYLPKQEMKYPILFSLDFLFLLWSLTWHLTFGGELALPDGTDSNSFKLPFIPFLSNKYWVLPCGPLPSFLSFCFFYLFFFVFQGIYMHFVCLIIKGACQFLVLKSLTPCLLHKILSGFDLIQILIFMNFEDPTSPNQWFSHFRRSHGDLWAKANV